MSEEVPLQPTPALSAREPIIMSVLQAIGPRCSRSKVSRTEATHAGIFMSPRSCLVAMGGRHIRNPCGRAGEDAADAPDHPAAVEGGAPHAGSLQGVRAPQAGPGLLLAQVRRVPGAEGVSCTWRLGLQCLLSPSSPYSHRHPASHTLSAAHAPCSRRKQYACHPHL